MASPGVLIDSAVNLTPVLQIITWLLECISVLAVFVKTGVKLRVIREFNEDDISILATLVFSIGQCVAVSLQNLNGFGQHLEALGGHQLMIALKSQYAGQILFIFSICFSKLSIAAFIQNLTPNTFDRYVIIGLKIVVIKWGLASVFAVAFQCRTPATWDFIGGKCFDRTAFWNAFGIISILTDIILVLLPLSIVIRIQTGIWKKITVSFYFMSRAVAIAATVVQLIYWNQYSSSSDPTFDQWLCIICTQVVLSASIITACLPQFKPLLDSLEHGMLRVDDLRRRGQTGLYGYAGRSGKDTTKAGYYFGEPKRSGASKKSDRELRGINLQDSIASSAGNIEMQTEFSITRERQISQGAWDKESEHSKHSTSRIIRETEPDILDESTIGIGV